MTTMTASSPNVTQGDRRTSCSDSPAFYEVVRDVIHAGSVQRLASETGLPASQLYRWGTLPSNPSDHGRKLPADAVVALSRATGRVDIIEHMARSLGCLVVPKPKAQPTGLSVLSSVGAVTREFGQVQAETAAALNDGAVSGEEAVRLAAELEDLLVAAATLLEQVQQAARKVAA